MKKLFGVLFVLSSLSLSLYADVVQLRGATTLNNVTDQQAYSYSCDEMIQRERYIGDGGIYTNYVSNSPNNQKTIYLWRYKTFGSGNYILNNKTYPGEGTNTPGVIVFNKPFLTANGRNWGIKPGEKIRHLTTAEEIGMPSYFEFGAWNFRNGPISPGVSGLTDTVQAALKFNNANYRVTAHPNVRKDFVSSTDYTTYDYQFRTMTLYNRDPNNLSTQAPNDQNRVALVCNSIVVRWCGDGKKETFEACDAGDIYNGNGNTNTCDTSNGPCTYCSDGTDGNNACTQVTVYPEVDSPTCSLTMNGQNNRDIMLGTEVVLNVNINGTYTNSPQVASNINNITGLPYLMDGRNDAVLYITPNAVGNYTISMTVSNSAGAYTCQATIVVDEDEPDPICGNGVLEGDEQCDDNNLVNNDGCNSACVLEEPDCSLVARPDSGPVDLSVDFSPAVGGTSKNSWARYVSIDYGDGSPINTNIDWNHTYTNIGTYNATLVVENNYGRQVNGVLPRSLCQDIINVYRDDVFVSIHKELTQPGVSHSLGSQVGFIIYVVNTGNNVIEGLSVVDIFPGSLDYQSNPLLVGFGQPNPTISTNIVNGDYQISVTNITINPQSTGYIILTGIVNEPSCDSSINFVSLRGNVLGDVIYYDTSEFDCGPQTLLEKNQRVDGQFTNGQITVVPGDLIEYRLVFQNIGGTDTVGGIIVSDMLPEGVNYINSDIVVWSGGIDISNTLNINFANNIVNGRNYIQYSGFDLQSGQSGYVLITGQISNNLLYSQYINTGHLEFFGPYMSEISNEVIAIREGINTVNINKNVVDINGNVVGGIPTFGINTGIYFAITISNLGDDISNIVVKDIWPDSTQNCIRYIGRSSNNNFTKNPNNLIWNYNGVLSQGDSIVLNLSGYIIDNINCIGDYVNTGVLDFILQGESFIGYTDEVEFRIIDARLLLNKNPLFESAVIGDRIGFKLYFVNQGNINIDNLIISDMLPRTIDYTQTNNPSLNSWTYECNQCPQYCRFVPLPSDSTSYTGYVQHFWSLQQVGGGNCSFEPGRTGQIIFTGTFAR